MTLKRRFQSLYSALISHKIGSRTQHQTIDDSIRAATNWIYKSQDVTETSGSAASYNLILGWEAPYPETTGYIIPTLYDVANEYNDSEAANRANKMSYWLLKTQLSNGAFPEGTYTGGDPAPSVFNTGQILLGLLRSFIERGDKRFKRSAVNAVDWLNRVQHNDGYWPQYDYNSIPHSYSSRISWPILEVANKFDLDYGYDLAIANLEWVLDQQQDNAWFERCSFNGQNSAYLHTIAYTIRGLLESSALLDGELAIRCESAAIEAANQLSQEQTENGLLPGRFTNLWKPTVKYRCITGNAQMVIIWAKIYELTGEQMYLNCINDTVNYLRKAQTLSGPDSVYGGVRGSDPVWGNYMYFRYPNWAAKFTIDAMLSKKDLEGTQ